MQDFEFLCRIRDATCEIASLERYRTVLVNVMITQGKDIKDMEELFKELPDCVDKIMLADKIRQTKKMKGQ